MNGDERLRIRTKLAFGVGSSAEAAIVVAFNTWNFLFYNQVLGLSGTLAGLAVTISLVLDGISEPLVGSISDRFRSKLGRRHPFMYAAPVPLAISFFLLYAPPTGLQGWGLFAWFTLFSTLHRQALTVYQIPHLALGAELSSDYHQRSIVMSYSAIFGTLGASATFFFGWTWFARIPGGASAREGYLGLAAAIGLFAALVIFASAYMTRDRIPRLAQPKGPAEPFELRRLMDEIAACLANPNYRAMLLGLLCMSATVGLRETLHSYVNLFFWELPATKIRVFGLATPPAFLVAFVLTVRLHRRFGKRNTLLYALALVVFAAVVPMLARFANLMPPNGSAQLTAVLLVFTFLFYGASAVQMITVLSALADVADEHELQTGQRNEGVLYAARTFASKLSSGFGHIVGGLAIDVIAFPTSAKPGHVAADIVDKLALLDGPIAAIPTVIGMLFYARYAIDRRRHAEIQQGLLALRTSRRAEIAEPKPAIEPSSAIEPTVI